MAFHSSRNRLSMPGSTSLYAICDSDNPMCGFLNRKTVTDSSGKKSKDRQWLSLWCQLKETKIEFYKVSGIAPKQHGDPPPRDIYPPPNRHQQKVGFLDLEGSLLEIDHTSQRNKDLDKRRKYLFRLILSNKMEYLFQAPSDHQMMQWVTNIRRVMFIDDHESEESDLLKQDVRIKASRCSINKKSKHNTNSIRVLGSTSDDTETDGLAPSLMDLDPRLTLLKKRLQSKRELVKQIDKMLKSFSGDTECLYRETDGSGSRRASHLATTDETDGLKPGTSNTFSNRTDHTITTLLGDYYLVPGMDWSLVKKGEQVEVLGRLPNGWYRCRALREAVYELESLPSSATEMIDNEEQHEDDHEESPHANKESNGKEESLESNEEDMSQEDSKEQMSPGRLRTDSYMMATSENSLIKNRPHSFLRKDSYKVATKGFVDSMAVYEMQKTRHLSLVSPQMLYNEADYDMLACSEEMIRLDLKTLINREREKGPYTFPLIGAIPPSLLSHFVSKAIGIRPSSLTSDYGSSVAAADDTFSAKVSHDDLSTSFETMPADDHTPSHIHDNETSSLDTSLRDETSSLGTSIRDETSSLGTSIRDETSSPGTSLRDETSSLDTSFRDDTSSPSTSSHTNGISSTIDVPKRSDTHLELEEELGSVPVGSIPAKLFMSQQNQQDDSLPTKARTARAASLPPTTASLEPVHELLAIDSNEDISRASLSGAPSLDLSLDVVGDINDEEFNKRASNTPRRRPSKGLKVVPSPSSSLERKVNPQVAFKEIQRVPSRSKRLHSEEIQAPKKGIFNRLRTNLLGHKKKGSRGESHLDVDELGDMRTRVTSISGKAIRTHGVAMKFGDSSSESESEDSEDKTKQHSTSEITTSAQLKKSTDDDDEVKKSSLSADTGRGPVSKSLSTPPPVTYVKTKTTDAPAEQDGFRRRLDSRSFSSRNLYDGSKMLDYIQPPPKRVQRTIYLDPTEKRYGVHLECYMLHMDQGQIPRVIVQHVVPGSPAFVAGLYPGDQILKVNQRDVSQSKVAEVVNLIQSADTERTLELIVAYVDGIHRLEIQSKGIDCRDQLRDRQRQLSTLVTSYSQTTSCATPSSTPPLTPLSPSALDISPWSRESMSDEESSSSLHIYPYDRHLNRILALCYDDVTQIPCDMLVIPIRSIGGHLKRIIKAGGEGLLDELCSAEQCNLGDNINTSGHNLPAQAICHAVFGSMEDDIISCCRSALEMAYEQNYKSIVFWIEGFTSAGVAPHVIIRTVRGWLEEGDNRFALDQIIFNILSTPALISLIERYFPLEDYERYKIIAALNYCTDSEDEDNEGRPKPVAITSPNTVPPLLPPKPGSPLPTKRDPLPSNPSPLSTSPLPPNPSSQLPPNSSPPLPPKLGSPLPTKRSPLSPNPSSSIPPNASSSLPPNPSSSFPSRPLSPLPPKSTSPLLQQPSSPRRPVSPLPPVPLPKPSTKHPKPTSKDSFIKNLSELDSIMTDLDQLLRH